MSVKSRSTSVLLLFFLLVILSFGIFLRFYSITDRPMHSDEGVNFHFVQRMMEEGYYHYSHKNYHGPTYFYLLYVAHSLLGSGELYHRLPAILSGVGVFMVPLLLVPFLSLRAVLPSIVLLACSSSLIFYSRYSIHEMFLVLASMLFLIFFYLWIEREKGFMLVLLGITLGLLIATKETFIIFCFAVCIAVFGTYSPKKVITRLFEDWFCVVWGFFFLVLVTISFFSGFFQHSEGLRELAMGVQQWINRGHSDSGHHKPYFYYAKMMIQAEPFAFLGVLPILYYLFRNIFLICREIARSGFSHIAFIHVFSNWYKSFSTGTDRIIFCTSLVALVSFLVYSYVPYKTPWLLVNIVAPSLLSFGLFISKIASHRFLYPILIPVLFFPSMWYALVYNYEQKSVPKVLQPWIHPVGAFSGNNPYVYVQTTDGMIEVVSDILRYFEYDPEGRVLIGVKNYWPFPYYLRDHGGRAGYRKHVKGEVPEAHYGILVLDKSMNLELEGWDKKYFRLSGVQESNVYYNRKKFPVHAQ